MNKIKRALCVLLAACFVLSLSACGTTENVSANINKISAYDAESADYTLSIDASNEIHDISDMLYGIFFEDINFSADGGLYAEMVANRSFEFTELAIDDQMYHWSAVGGAQTEVKVDDTENCLNANNTNYIVVTNSGAEPAGIANTGFLEGMSISEQKYDFSVYAKALDGYTGGLTARLCVGDKIAAEYRIDSITDEWEKYTGELESELYAGEDVTLQVLADKGTVALDMISLFPDNTFKGRENGLREDVATLLEELHPSFLRFPGGCVIEGYDEATAYDWKASVGADENGEPLEFNGTYGDVAARRQGINLWTDINATDDEWPSFMSYGLGFYEFFLLSEDIGAVGVPVINAGMFCQGRQCEAVDMDTDEFKAYVQDMLDLIEFCRGDESTKWGKVRCSLGHEEPFELKYICIGNENEGETYHERYQVFLDTFNKAKESDPDFYEGIELIYSSGTDDAISGNENYHKAYEYAKSQLDGEDDAGVFAGAIDSHYYNDPKWFLKHADYYDENNYKRSVDEMTDTEYGGAIDVFLGEYASWSNNMNSALAEAAYMTGLERNGDIVRMTTYAPLLSSTTARHWAPDLIWFNNGGVQPSANYYMQRLFSTNAGTKLLSSTLDGAFIGDKDIEGMVGVGTWMTTAEFDNVLVTDNVTGEVIAQDGFDSKSDFKNNWENVNDSAFEVKDGKLCETASAEEPENGSIAFLNGNSATNYTFTVDATKISGDEGFFIPFAVKDGSNAYFWNIGGWGNQVSCLQMMQNGIKSGQLEGTTREFVVEDGKTYQLKIVVDHTNIKCYIDGELYIDYETSSTAEAEAYQVVSTDESGDIIIKLVNVTADEKCFAIDINGAVGIQDTVKAYQVRADSATAENIFGQDESVTLNEFELEGISDRFNYTAPRFSATVIRIKKG